jgi:hypothetical protein
MNSLSFIINLKQEVIDASILYEMSCKEGNERCQGDNYEEWEASDSGDMPNLRHEDVQDREELEQIFIDIGSGI